MHWIIGTAGHIDHGKTTLVKALTGQDTDRLKEEKERGISIDLGFAHLDLADDARAGVVDVPGHERFIRNMLAGAHGIDLVLFTVAADDGVMPQTREHLDILHLLGVSRAIFVVTKTDLVSASRVREVGDDIRALIAGTSLDGAPICAWSAVTGEGLDALVARIHATLHGGVTRSDRGYFRLPIDRAFAVRGHGLIVTGTAIGGEVRIGDLLRRVPGGESLRVRSIEVHNAPVEAAVRGQRVALNLAGQTRTPIERGDVVCDEHIASACERFDAHVEVRPTATDALEDHQRVRVHLGTAERMGKVIPLGSRGAPETTEIGPGETAYCQIVVEEPLLVLKGDRFILRDETAQRTIGGGVVVLSDARRHRRRDPSLLPRLETIDHGDGAPLVGALIDERAVFALPLPALARALNTREEDIPRRFDGVKDVHVFQVEGHPHYTIEARRARIKAAVREGLAAWHAAHPLATGLDLEEARTTLADTVPARIFRILVDDMSEARELVREGNLLRLPHFQIALPEADRKRAADITTALGREPLAPPDAKQLATALGVDYKTLVGLLRALEKQGVLVHTTADLYFLREKLDELRADLVRALTATGGMTTGQFRDRYRTSRKYAIPLLEYFDRTGVTVRIGEMRQLKTPPRSEPV